MNHDEIFAFGFGFAFAAIRACVHAFNRCEVVTMRHRLIPSLNDPLRQ